MSYPRGNIALSFCEDCGFIWNTKFDPEVLEYSSEYEETQAYSATFNDFHRDLATRLIRRFHLHHKDILEIGCGKGDFLILLCELGNNRGVGFDPAYVPGRTRSEALDRITFITDRYSEKYANYKADCVCCKMTLEHIPNTSAFLRTIRRALCNSPRTDVFFQVPDVVRILRKQAFWDIYYEHSSYFSLGSLARLFRTCQFDVFDLAKGYDDQYLMIEARPGDGVCMPALAAEQDMVDLREYVATFSETYQHRLDAWKSQINEWWQQGKRTVIWGAGSKAVAFLTTLRLGVEIDYVVDINPFKQGTFLAGTGHGIEAPAVMRERKPDVVIVINRVYLTEILSDLREMGLSPEIVAL